MSARDAALPLAFEAVSFEAGGARLLHALTFALGAGPISVLLGPNGAGKSLTLRLAHGLIVPSAGHVRWLGAAGEAARERSAMLFQRPVLLRRSVAANLRWALRLRGVSRGEASARAARVLEAMRLGALASRPARLLSVGEQQRLALARAFALAPEVLFLDEPAAALDPGSAHALESAIGEIAASGTKVVMATHDLGQARRLAGEVLFLHRGRLLEQTPAEEFFREPRCDAARKFSAGEILD